MTGVIAGVLVATLATLDGNPPAVPDNVSLLCIEAGSGRIVYEVNGELERPPASMVKMMMMLLVVEGLESGAWTLEDPIEASRHTEQMGGSQVFLRRGEVHPLGRLMQAVAVKSANDAAMCVAEGLWGSEAAYLARMNERAQELGMKKTVFRSVHGLPPSPGEAFDQTTARDMAILGRACLRYPLIREWTTLKEFQFRERDGLLYNTNKLLWRMNDCDGLKTGFIRAAGFCLTATAERDGVRLLVVVMGHENGNQRFRLAQDTFDYGFNRVQRAKMVARGDALGGPIPVLNSRENAVTLTASEDLWVTAIDGELDRITVKADLPYDVVAPVNAGAELGEVYAELDGEVVSAVPLVAPKEIAEAGWDLRIQDRIGNFAGGR